MGGTPNRRFFTFGLVAGAVPLASRLSFSSASAVGAAVRAVPIAPWARKSSQCASECVAESVLYRLILPGERALLVSNADLGELQWGSEQIGHSRLESP
jgi:hypothetical protein